jgi:hypothetical protein
MATSLKAFLPVLSRILGETPDALYERQRALMREGMLEASAGRGPGSGVRATPETVALLVIGLLASASLSDAGPRARSIADARPGYPKHKCPLTGATTFAGVLGKVLSDEQISKRVTELNISPSGGLASIRYDDTISLSLTKTDESKVRFTASIDAKTVQALAKAVSGLVEEPS